jgi:hypothetical protein
MNPLFAPLVRKLRPYLRAVLDIQGYTGLSATALYSAYRELLLTQERYRDPRRLLTYGFKSYSQNDEDGIIQEIFRRIGCSNRTFIECGVSDGTQNNTVYLLLTGWRGLWVDADRQNAAEIGRLFASFLQSGQLSFSHAVVGRDNINALVEAARFSGEIDLFSIDIDGNDYWVWEALSAVSPRVVVIEYNAVLRPPLRLVMEYKKDAGWQSSNYGGASLNALAVLGEKKGYRLVGCCLAGVNAFFVRQDLVEDRFLAPFTAENHFEPSRYGFAYANSDVHRPGIGPYVAV